MIVCPSCGRANEDWTVKKGRRHCVACGCYLPLSLHEEDVRHSTWSNLSMLRMEAELMNKKGLISMYDGEYIDEFENRMNHATATVLYDDMREQILVCGDGNIVRVIR